MIGFHPRYPLPHPRPDSLAVLHRDRGCTLADLVTEGCATTKRPLSALGDRRRAGFGEDRPDENARALVDLCSPNQGVPTCKLLRSVGYLCCECSCHENQNNANYLCHFASYKVRTG